MKMRAFCFLVIAVLVAVPANAADDEQRRKDAEALVTAFWERVWSPPADLTAVDDLVAEDFVLTSAGTEVKGRDAFRAWIEAFQTKAKDIQLEPFETFANADATRVTSRWARERHQQWGARLKTRRAAHFVHRDCHLGDPLDAGRTETRPELGRAERLGTLSATHGGLPLADRVTLRVVRGALGLLLVRRVRRGQAEGRHGHFHGAPACAERDECDCRNDRHSVLGRFHEHDRSRWIVSKSAAPWILRRGYGKSRASCRNRRLNLINP